MNGKVLYLKLTISLWWECGFNQALAGISKIIYSSLIHVKCFLCLMQVLPFAFSGKFSNILPCYLLISFIIFHSDLLCSFFSVVIRLFRVSGFRDIIWQALQTLVRLIYSACWKRNSSFTACLVLLLQLSSLRTLQLFSVVMRCFCCLDGYCFFVPIANS